MGEYDRQYYLKNRERILERVRRYQQENREAVLEKNRTYYQANKGKWESYVDSRTPEQINEASRRYGARHPDRRKASNRKWLKAHPDYAREARRRRRVIQSGAEGSHTEKEWRMLLEIYDGRCAYCGEEATTRDHVVSLARGGTDNIDNIVPACKPCNSSKGVKYLWEWRII